MSLILETVQTDGIAELSYLIGDDKTGTAAVIVGWMETVSQRLFVRNLNWQVE